MILLKRNEADKLINLMNTDLNIIKQLLTIDIELADKKLKNITLYLEKMINSEPVDIRYKAELYSARNNLISIKEIANNIDSKISRNTSDLANILLILLDHVILSMK